MRKLLLAAIIGSFIGGPANAQLLSASSALSPRVLPAGASTPTIAPTDLVYPGCPVPPTSFGHIWFIDPVNGHTQSGGGLGTSAAPWNSLQALLGSSGAPVSGYTTMLLSTAPHGGFAAGPVNPGDEVVLNTGNYGDLAIGAQFTLAAIVNSPALTIAAGTGQTPLFTSLFATGSSGFVFDGTNGDFKVQSQLGSATTAMITVQDGNLSGFTATNFVFNHMDISSASVATADAWTQAQWLTNGRFGVKFDSSDNNTALNCVSMVNSHVYVTQGHNFGAISSWAASTLIQNNEIDHFSTDAIEHKTDNVAIINNNIHDSVLVNPASGDQYLGIHDISFFPRANLFISRNKVIESIDASQLFQAGLGGISNTTSVITNGVIIDNLIAGSGCQAVNIGTVQNGIVANNSVIDGGTVSFEQGCLPSIVVAQNHGGSTGPEGPLPLNVRVFNNIAPAFAISGQNVQTDHNISTGLTQSLGGSTQAANVFAYASGWSGCLLNPVTSQVVATSAAIVHTGPSSCSADAGANNWVDGIGGSGAGAGANEFTAVPTPGSFPMSPQPNWTPKSGSPAKIFGGAVLIPPITDFNGAAFAPPYSFGALN